MLCTPAYFYMSNMQLRHTLNKLLMLLNPSFMGLAHQDMTSLISDYSSHKKPPNTIQVILDVAPSLLRHMKITSKFYQPYLQNISVKLSYKQGSKCHHFLRFAMTS